MRLNKDSISYKEAVRKKQQKQKKQTKKPSVRVTNRSNFS
jgi:hypothetical protein